MMASPQLGANHALLVERSPDAIVPGPLSGMPTICSKLGVGSSNDSAFLGNLNDLPSSDGVVDKMLQRIEPQGRSGPRVGWMTDKPRPSHYPRVQSQLALRLLAEASGVKRVGLAPVNPENS